jgi:hypothetical protein
MTSSGGRIEEDIDRLAYLKEYLKNNDNQILKKN